MKWLLSVRLGRRPKSKLFDDTCRLGYPDDSYRQNTMNHPPQIGRAELDILRYIGDHHPISVREVAEHVAATKGHVRTTVLNVMERLRVKGYLTRKRIDGVFQYSPRIPKSELLQNLVREFVERALAGSVSPFVAYLTSEAKVTEPELKKLKVLVRELESQRKENKL